MYNKDLYPKANKVLLELRTNKANPPFLGHQNPAAKKNQSNKSLCLMLEAPLFMVKYLEIHLAGRKKNRTLPRRGRVFRGRALQPCASLSTTCPVDADMEWYEWIGFRQNLQDTIFFPPNMDLVWIYFGVQYRAVGGIHRSGITMGFKGSIQLGYKPHKYGAKFIYLVHWSCRPTSVSIMYHDWSTRVLGSQTGDVFLKPSSTFPTTLPLESPQLFA